MHFTALEWRQDIISEDFQQEERGGVIMLVRCFFPVLQTGGPISPLHHYKYKEYLPQLITLQYDVASAHIIWGSVVSSYHTVSWRHKKVILKLRWTIPSSASPFLLALFSVVSKTKANSYNKTILDGLESKLHPFLIHINLKRLKKPDSTIFTAMGMLQNTYCGPSCWSRACSLKKQKLWLLGCISTEEG